MNAHAVTSIATERLIGEVAKRHDLLLSRDDPVLVTVTLNELILAEALKQLRASLDAASESIAGSAARHIEASKLVAEQLITAAADYVANEVRTAAADIGMGGTAAPPAQASACPGASSLAWTAAAIAIAAACISGALAVAGPLLKPMAPTSAQCEGIKR